MGRWGRWGRGGRGLWYSRCLLENIRIISFVYEKTFILCGGPTFPSLQTIQTGTPYALPNMMYALRVYMEGKV